MRPLRDIIKELRSKPLWYWLGWDEPFTYVIQKGRVFAASKTGRVEVLVLSQVEEWKRSGKMVTLYQADGARIIMDPRNRLGSILEKELPEKWIVQEEEP